MYLQLAKHPCFQMLCRVNLSTVIRWQIYKTFSDITRLFVIINVKKKVGVTFVFCYPTVGDADACSVRAICSPSGLQGLVEQVRRRYIPLLLEGVAGGRGSDASVTAKLYL